MAMFSSYYDTSGRKDQPIMVTAGILGSERQWLRLEKEWRAALLNAGVPYVHMTEIPTMFKGRDTERYHLLQSLVRLLVRRTTMTFCVTLDVEEYYKYNKTHRLEESFSRPLALCATTCAKLAEEWLAKVHPNQPLRHYHEDGDDDRNELIAMAKLNGVAIALEPAQDEKTREWFVPFQATDFLAYESRRGYSDAVNESPHDFRPAFVSLVQNLKTQRIHIDRDRLETLTSITRKREA